VKITRDPKIFGWKLKKVVETDIAKLEGTTWFPFISFAKYENRNKKPSLQVYSIGKTLIISNLTPYDRKNTVF
jgi:hypothetical protein